MSCPVHGKMVGLRILSKSNKFSYRCSGISSGKVCGQMDMKVYYYIIMCIIIIKYVYM